MKPLDLSDKSAAFMAALAGTASWAHSPTPATCISGYILNSCEGIT
jgi:hypothetical protein